ncbi:MAG: hypothetical protein OHK0039_30090 [Bacteroidia bacterium]
MYEDLTLDEMLARLAAEEMNLPQGSVQHEVVVMVQAALIDQMFDEMETPVALCNPMGLYRVFSEPVATRQLIVSVPKLVQDVSDRFFEAKMLLVWFFFLPFLMVRVGEYVLFRLVVRLRQGVR